MGYSRIAFNNFQQLISRYPNSAYAPDAALRMRYIYNQLAENEMQAARWYVKRKFHVAAANRAKWVSVLPTKRNDPRIYCNPHI